MLRIRAHLRNEFLYLGASGTVRFSTNNTMNALTVNHNVDGNGRITYLTVEQTKRLIECAKESDNSHVYAFYCHWRRNIYANDVNTFDPQREYRCHQAHDLCSESESRAARTAHYGASRRIFI
jgi:hypothetical protein